jgi:hypothetical protein
MRQFLVRLAGLALILSTAACGGTSGPEFIWFRAMHAMPDGPGLRASYDDFAFRRNLAFGLASDEVGESLLSASDTSALLTVEYRQPDGTIAGTLLTLDVPVEKDSMSTVIVTGWFDAPETVTIVTPRRPRPLAALYFQFAHAAPGVGALDVYVTGPDTELSSTAPLATIQPLGHSASVEVPFGDTHIRLTAAGTLDLVMDSGKLTFPEVTASTGPGAEWLFVARHALTGGASPVSLMATSGRNNVTYHDLDTPATVRAVHAAAGVGAVDFLAATDPETQLYSGLEYRQRSPLVAAPPGKYNLEFRAVADASVVATRPFELIAGNPYAAFLITTDGADGVLLSDSPARSIATEARMRFGNVAPDSEFFSIYLTSSETEERSAENRLVLDMRFGTITPYLARAPGQYFLTLTERFYETAAEAEDAVETVTLGPLPLELSAGDVLSLLLFAPEEGSQTEVLEIFDDRLP